MLKTVRQCAREYVFECVLNAKWQGIMNTLGNIQDDQKFCVNLMIVL